MPAQNIFERKEKKYVMSRAQADALLAAVAEHVEPDEYPDASISSTYYDTPSHAVIERSMEKPVYKEKLRVRDYGTGSVFVELKKKLDGIVYKRRIEMSRECAHAWLDEGMGYAEAMDAFPLAGRAGELTYADRQISREVEAFVSRYRDGLVPSMDVSVHRLSYRERGREDGCRMTLDESMTYCDIMAGQQEARSLCDEVVLEVKIRGAYPLWLTHALAELGLRPTSFSKYGTAYRRLYLLGAGSKPISASPAVSPSPSRLPVAEGRPVSYNGKNKMLNGKKAPAYA